MQNFRGVLFTHLRDRDPGPGGEGDPVIYLEQAAAGGIKHALFSCLLWCLISPGDQVFCCRG